MKKQKVMIAMSGGVDSSVAAFLLKKQGYEVIGAFMKNWSDTKNVKGECSWRDERRYAMKIAAILDIPFITLDFEKEYKSQVVKDMFKNYKKGITPNPDILCNQKIKFPLLWKEAKKRKCDLIATGHFVKLKKNKKNDFFLERAKDEKKDQSYFLYKLTDKDLSHTLFPVGNLTKEKIRDIAKKEKFPNWDKKGTVGICFIGKINLKNFLKQKIKPKKGNILNPEGEKIGEHDGIYYYTIGQRIGPRFGIEVQKNSKYMKKWYVAKKNLRKNEIIAAPENHKILYRKEIYLDSLHLINKKSKLPEKITVRIRHVGELLPATIKKIKSKYKIVLKKPITGISEGQAAVIYDKRICLGGGEIKFN